MKPEFQKSHRDLSDFVDNATVGLHWVGGDGCILWANKADCALLGFELDEYVGHHIREFHADLTALDGLLTRLSAGETMRDFAARLRCKDGSIRHVLINSSVLFDDQGKFLHTRCFTRDVTEQTKIEAELRTSRKAFAALADISRSFALASFDLPLIFKTVTDKIVELLGDACGIRLLSADGKWLQSVATSHRNPAAVPLLEELARFPEPAADGLSGKAIEARDLMVLGGLPDTVLTGYSERMQKALAQFPVRCVVVAPLIGTGKILGTLSVVRHDPLRPFLPWEQQFLRDVADRAAVAVITATQHLALVAERQHLNAVIQQMPSAVAIVEAPSGRLLVSNHQNEQIFKQPMRALSGIQEYAAFKGLHPHGRELLAHEWPLSRSLLTGEVVRGEEIAIVRGDGSRGTIRVNSAPVRDARGKTVAGVVTYDDVSGELQAREQLVTLSRASVVLADSLDYETTLNAVISLALPDLGDFGFFDVVEEDEKVRRIVRVHQDPRVEELLRGSFWVGSEKPEANLCALTTGRSEFHPEISEAWLDEAATSPAHRAAMKALGFVSMISVPFRYQAKTLGALTLFYGTSGRHHTPQSLTLAEELGRRCAAAVQNARLFKQSREAVEVRDDFLSMAGHELRTPLTALQLQLSSLETLLQGGAPGARVLERAQKANRNLARFVTVVDELLDISRISAGKLTLERAATPLPGVVRDVVGRFSEEAIRAGSLVQVRGEEQVVGHWDPLRIEQVVTNLFTNAIKYGAGKPIEIDWRVHGGNAELKVRDHGIGIAASDLRRVFERFERAVPARHFGGLGLGLWIARELVGAHGGSIRAESVVGQGSTFIVELPLAAVAGGGR